MSEDNKEFSEIIIGALGKVVLYQLNGDSR